MLNYLIIPLSCLFVVYFPSIPFYHGQRIQFYFMILLIIWEVISRKGVISKDIFPKRLLLFLIVVFVTQLVNIAISYVKIDISRYLYSPITEFFSLLLFVFSLLVYYVAIKMRINSYDSIRKVLSGCWYALLFSLLVCYVQLFYVFFPNIFQSSIDIFASTIEARWFPELPSETVHRFYTEGSYVETTKRINGLTQEAQTNALFLIIAFVPFLVSSIRNRYNIFSQKKGLQSIYLALLSVIIILIMSKTSLGIILSIIILLSVLKNLTPVKKLFLFLLIIIVPLIIFSSSLDISYITNIFDEYLGKISDTNVASTANRSGNTIALLLTIVSSLFLGVGRGYLDYYVFTNTPQWATQNFEYAILIQSGSFPVLSSLFGFIAEFGIVVFILIAIFIKSLFISWREVEITSLTNEYSHLIRTLKDAFRYFIIFFLVGSMFSLDWFASIYIVIFFFFVCTLIFVKKKGFQNAEK